MKRVFYLVVLLAVCLTSVGCKEDVEPAPLPEISLAEAFGLSQATLSRFAGSRWRSGARTRLPDLWRNVAQTLARHTAFIEMAEKAGVWGKVQRVLGQPTGGRSDA